MKLLVVCALVDGGKHAVSMIGGEFYGLCDQPSDYAARALVPELHTCFHTLWAARCHHENFGDAERFVRWCSRCAASVLPLDHLSPRCPVCIQALPQAES